MPSIEACIRCGQGRWSGLAPVCANCSSAYAAEVREAAIAFTTEYLATPGITLRQLKPRIITLIEALDGVATPVQ